MLLIFLLFPCFKANFILFALKKPDILHSVPWKSMKSALRDFEHRIHREEEWQCENFEDFAASIPDASSLSVLLFLYKKHCAPWEVLNEKEELAKVMSKDHLTYKSSSSFEYKKKFCLLRGTLLEFEYKYSPFQTEPDDSPLVHMKIQRKGAIFTCYCSVDGDLGKSFTYDQEHQLVKYIDHSSKLVHIWNTKGEIKYLGIKEECEIWFSQGDDGKSRIIQEAGKPKKFYRQGIEIAPFKVHLGENEYNILKIHQHSHYKHPLIIGEDSIDFPFITDFEPFKWYEKGIFVFQREDFFGSLSYHNHVEWEARLSNWNFSEACFLRIVPHSLPVKMKKIPNYSFSDLFSPTEIHDILMQEAKRRIDLEMINFLRREKVTKNVTCRFKE